MIEKKINYILLLSLLMMLVSPAAQAESTSSTATNNTQDDEIVDNQASDENTDDNSRNEQDEHVAAQQSDDKTEIALMSIIVKDVEADIEDNLRAWLPKSLACDAKRFQQNMWRHQALKEAEKSLQALGYYNATFDILFIHNTEEPELCPCIQINVNADEPVKYRNVSLNLFGEGSEDPLITDSWAKLAIKPGEILHHGHYESAKSHLSQRLEEYGYFDAEYLKSQVLVNPDALTADLNITLDTHSRYHFGEINLNQDILHPYFVKRYSPVATGDHFDANTLNELSQNLSASGYFSDVRIRQSEPNPETETVEIDVELVPRKRMSYAFSVGYGTDTGERIGGDVTRHWVNKRGHHAYVGGIFSDKKRLFETRYVIPWDKPLSERLEWGFRYLYERNDNWGEDTTLRFGPAFHRDLDNDWTGVAFIELLSGRTEFKGDMVREGEFAFIGVRLNKRVADDPILPSEGWSIMSELKMSDPGWLSKTSLVQAKLNVQNLLPIGNKGAGLVLKAQAGASWVEDFDRLPKALRFYTGGDTSVRGYTFESLAPRNQQGVLIGGQHYLAATAEYLHPVSESILLASFVDIGDAFNDWDKGLENLKEGAGVGVRYRTPVGYIKADIAFPVSKKEPFSRPMLHLGIGASF